MCLVLLQHCTLTNKVKETIFRDLSIPPQRRQGPDPCSTLIVSRDSFSPWRLASRWAEHSLLLRMSIYIFDILHVFISCNDFYGLSNLVGSWSPVFIAPREGPGVKSRMCPPYPQRDRKRRLNGAVLSESPYKKGWSRVGVGRAR